MDAKVYKFKGEELPDPGPEFAAEDVQKMYAPDYPGLLNAAPSYDEKDGVTVINFEERTKKKG